MPMLRAIKKYAEEKKIKAYISLEELWPAAWVPAWAVL